VRSSTKPISFSRRLTNSGEVKPAALAPPSEPIAIQDLLENGQGVGRIGDLVAFVTGALPGERARIAIDEVKRSYVSAHATSIEEASPDRVDPGCPVFPRCGGCQTLHFRYEAELAWKRALVRDALARIGGIETSTVHESISATAAREGYRNKVTLVCELRSAQPALGFYAARSHRLVPIQGCPVLLPRLASAVEDLISLARHAPAAFAGVERIVARASSSTRDLVISFNGRKPVRGLGPAIPELRRRVPDLTGITTSWDLPSENAVFGRRSATLWGSPFVREELLGAQLRFSIASFFQINSGILSMLAAKILESLAGSERVVDLYCGVGTFGVLLGKAGIASTGVESHAPAANEAAANAANNGVTNAAFESAAAAVATAGKRGETLFGGASAVIVDPPRKGCEPEVLGSIAAARVPRIVYVSCNPSTLARDARRLVDDGYALTSATPFDMFPRTGHVEVLAEFARTR
jgi:23S rRNA (uracil1939-C5)-methyltransferase